MIIVQTPPAQTFGKGHLARGGPFCLSMSMLFTDIKLVGFFSNIPLELAFGKKNQAHHRASFIIRLPSRY